LGDSIGTVDVREKDVLMAMTGADGHGDGQMRGLAGE